MEAARKIARDVRGLFKKAVDVQCDHPFNVAMEIEGVKTQTEEIVRRALEKLLGGVATNLEGLKNKICEVHQEHLNYSQKTREYLYTCKSGISATLYIDVSLIL